MPSPFLGMDPFIESRVWKDFRTRLVPELASALLPSVRPRYVVRAEERIYLEHSPANDLHSIQPDVAVLQATDREVSSRSGGGVATAVAMAPVLMTLSMPEQEREVFLTVRELESMDVVTVIELLAPSNKRAGSDGRREYLAKREAVVRSAAHLVELDLLRAGERLPTVQPLPPADYYAFVRRKPFSPQVEVYRWWLRQRLPVIPIPLAGDDPDALLDLQAAFDTVYDRAGYDYSLDYRHPVEPLLSEEDAAWVRSVWQPHRPAEADRIPGASPRPSATPLHPKAMERGLARAAPRYKPLSIAFGWRGVAEGRGEVPSARMGRDRAPSTGSSGSSRRMSRWPACRPGRR